MVQSGAMRIERPNKTLRELALDKMRRAILDFYFKPGERLVERDLCTQLGVSRTIVREVLRHLESEGLVANQPNRGPIVAETTPEEALQIYEIRAALEPMAARACARQATPEIVAALEEALEGIESAYGRGDLPGVLSLTTEFYRTLFQASGREIAWETVNSLTSRINMLRSLTIKTANRKVDGPGEMRAILDAVRMQDEEAAALAARTHVEKASRIARDILEERRNG